MVAARTTLPDLHTLDGDALRAMIVAQHEQLLSHQHEIQHLTLLIAKLQRMQFGRKSEKIERQIEQLELKLEELEANRSEQAPPLEQPSPTPRTASKPARRPLPPHLPRELKTHEPEQHCCPECGGTLSKLGEDVSEVLEYIPESFKVIRHVRPKLSCTACDVIVQAPAPSRPIERGIAGPALLAHVLTSKYCDHLPLHRQNAIYARQGVDLEDSTLADWVGASSRLVQPLVEALRRYVLGGNKLHADDTPVPVLAPGNGKDEDRAAVD
jgi:transposase